METGQVPQLVIDIGVFCGVIAGIGAAGTVVRRWVEGLHNAAVEQIDNRVTERLDAVLHELRINSGMSLRDAVDRTEADIARLRGEVAQLRHEIQGKQHESSQG